MKFNVFKNSKGKWQFQIVAGNGKVIALSGSYTRKRNAVDAVAVIKAGAVQAKVEELV